MGGCFLCGGYRQDELGRVSAHRVDVDPADLLHQLGQVGVRRSESVQAGKATCSRSVWKAARMLCATRAGSIQSGHGFGNTNAAKPCGR